MPESDFEKMHSLVLLKLKGLDSGLTYHCTNHTLDVLKQATRIASDEAINAGDLYLLQVACLYHDTGFLKKYIGHEEESCRIFSKDSENFNFTEEEKAIILGLIMATKVPQQPTTLLQKIICDADLDYLGRNDFEQIAALLKNEFVNFDMVANDPEWHSLQLKFLKNHHYHTRSSQLLREPVKELNYASLL